MFAHLLNARFLRLSAGRRPRLCSPPSRLHGTGLAGGVLLLAALTLTPAGAQTTFAAITGTVRDPGGAIIVGAQIEATHLASNYHYKATSNEAGNYTLAQLREGDYVLHANASGFTEFEAKDIKLVARDVRRIDISLTVSAVQSSVEVTAGPTVIETETARISDTRTEQSIRALPVDRGGFALWNYLALSPAVTTSTEGSWRRFSGSNRSQSSTAIDGIATDDFEGGNQISPLTGFVDSFAEVRIDSANNSAEFGAIGQVTVISRSGTNNLHGTVFDYYQTPGFRARNPFASARANGISHAPGGSIGGPVYIPKLYDGRNKTFFFFSVETTRGSEVTQNLTPTVPLQAWRNGDFSSLLPNTVIHDPFTGLPFVNNRIPADRLNPVAVKLQDRFFPLPNYGDTSIFQDQNYREMKARPFDPNTYVTARADHRISSKSFFFARMTWQRSWDTSFDSDLPAIGRVFDQRNTRGLASSLTYAFRPNLLNEIRYGINYDNEPVHGTVMGKQLVNELGLKGLWDNLPDIQGLPQIGFSQLGITGISQSSWADPGNSKFGHFLQESISWFHGRHSVKAGFNYMHGVWAEQAAGGSLFGNLDFSNRFTGFTYSDFLMGIPTGMYREPPPIYNQTVRNNYDWYVTDEVKVTPNLTLTAGLRYELHPYWTGDIAGFDIKSGKIVVPDGNLSMVSPLFPKNFVDIVPASKVGYAANSLLKTDRNNFAPRIGIAYRPWGNHTVLRSGFGIFYDTTVFKADAASSPYRVTEPDYTNPSTPNVILPWMFPAGGSGAASASIPTAFRPDLRVPYSMQYNFTIEHQMGSMGLRASYVGTTMRQGIYRYNINQPVADGRPYAEKPRLFPQYADILYITNGSFHDYNGLTVEVKRQMSRGLTFQASWVWARDIGDLGWYYSMPEDAYNRARERGPWVDIPTHRLTFNMLYELPFGNGRHFLAGASKPVNTLVGGWELAVVGFNQTGQFLTPLWSGPDPTGTRYSASDSPADVTIRPDILYNPNLSQPSVGQWFDPHAFAAPQPGHFGTSGKGVVIGPGSMVYHATLGKYVTLKERVKLRVEMAAFNFLNHPNWANPRMNITSSPGVIRNVVGRNDLDNLGPRKLRAGIRLEW